MTIAALGRFADGIGAADRPGVQSLVAQVRNEQAEANLALAPHVSPERTAALVEMLEGLAADAAALVAVPEAPAESSAGEGAGVGASANGGARR